MSNKWVNLSDIEREFIKSVVPNSTLIEKSILKKMIDSDKRISVASAKGKGRNLQHFCCERISALINIPFNNKDDDSLIRSREMGQSGVDVVLRGEAKERFPFSVECKSCENISFRNFVEQAKKYSKDGRWLLVIRTKSLPDTTVTMPWDTFENLFQCKFIQKEKKK